jgi:hypothetical protein
MTHPSKGINVGVRDWLLDGADAERLQLANPWDGFLR